LCGTAANRSGQVIRRLGRNDIICAINCRFDKINGLSRTLRPHKLVNQHLSPVISRYLALDEDATIGHEISDSTTIRRSLVETSQPVHGSRTYAKSDTYRVAGDSRRVDPLATRFSQLIRFILSSPLRPLSLVLGWCRPGNVSRFEFPPLVLYDQLTISIYGRSRRALRAGRRAASGRGGIA
jgi:hypothetical protein